MSWRASASVRDLRVLGEAMLVIVVTWLALGWTPDHATQQADGTQVVLPYMRDVIAAGGDWTRYLYRADVLGGAAMSPVGGVMPLAQLCGVLGLSPLLACDLLTWCSQLCFAYLGLIGAEALATRWTGGRVRFDAGTRIVTYWLCAFVPALGWRLGMGHENLVYGLLPYAAGIALLLASSAGTLTRTSLAVATFAVANGVSTYGAQTVVYGAVFGAPIAAAAIALAPRGQRWTLDRLRVLAALAAGVLVVAPRVAVMIHYATGDDASRALHTSLVYEFATTSWRDWLTSIPWTTAPAFAAHPHFAQEYNFPIGPVLVVLAGMWPRGSRRIAIALAVSAVAALVLADHVSPLSDAMLRVVPPLNPFRVPARAILPVLLVVPVLLAAAWRVAAGEPTDDDRRGRWVSIAVGVLIVAVGRHVPEWPREIVAWLACVAVVLIARRGSGAKRARVLATGLAPIAALAVVAFGARIPTDLAIDTLDGAPAQLRDAALSQVPNASGPLARITVPAPAPAWSLNEQWAAGLGEVDGYWFPARRFITLLSAVTGQPGSPVLVIFVTFVSRQWPIYQQLYDIVGVISVRRAELQVPPPPAGAAWFPHELVAVDHAPEVGAALRAADTHLHELVTGTAWITRDDPASPAPRTLDPACAHAAIRRVTRDADHQALAIDVDAPADCVLVVSQNYVGMMHAHAADGAELPVFPIDIALTGVDVPRGTTSLTLAPEVHPPGWSGPAAAIGALLLLGALVGDPRRRRA